MIIVSPLTALLYVAPGGNDANSCVTLSTACLTITAAVSKAVSGDTIVISAGTYTEAVGIAKDLTLIGFGADATIINQGRIVVTNATVRIFDLAITNSNNDTGGAVENDMGIVSLGYTSILSSHAFPAFPNPLSPFAARVTFVKVTTERLSRPTCALAEIVLFVITSVPALWIPSPGKLPPFTALLLIIALASMVM